MPKNLLIGSITNYIWDDVAPFFNSYVQAGFENCDCVMFTTNMSEETLNKIRACGVTVLPIPERFSGCCIIDFRWELYRDYLLSHKDSYAAVFTADVRDVVLQTDVFKHFDYSCPFLGVALEDGCLSEEYDKNWLLNRYGNSVYEALKENRIICAGTVWGTADKFLELASAVTENINSEKYTYFRICDQPTVNWLIYHEGMFKDCLKPSTNHDGYVMTIGLTDEKNIHTDSDGNVLNDAGEIAAVVHQYDRKPRLAGELNVKYSAGMSGLKKLSLRYNLLGRTFGFLYRMHRRGFIFALKAAITTRLERRRKRRKL